MKKLLLVCAVLIGYVHTMLGTSTDVTATYLQNYTKPYVSTGVLLNTNSRFKQLAAPWITSGDLGTMGVDYTSWHIDGGKGDALTLTASWDGFSASVQNMKVYQTVTLPAGSYELSTTNPVDGSGKAGTYIVVDDSTGVPDIAKLSRAIGSSQASQSMKVSFQLSHQTQVSIGLVATLGAWQCMTIGTWTLLQFEGANYNALNELITKIKSYTDAQYPTGTTLGKFTQSKWDALQTALANAEAYVSQNQNDTQANVDAQTATLQTALDNLNNSCVLPSVSTELSTKWYLFKASRPKNTYLTSGGVGAQTKSVALIPDDSQLWKLVPNTGGTVNGFALVNKATGEYLDADGAEDTQLNTKAMMPDNNLRCIPSTKITDGVCEFWIENSVGSSPNFRLHAGNGGPMNWTGDAEDNSTWLIQDYSEQLKPAFETLRTTASDLYTYTPEGTEYGQFSEQNKNVFLAAITAANTKNAETMTLEELQAATIELKAAMDAYKATMVTDITTITSTAAAPKWYSIIGSNLKGSSFDKVIKKEGTNVSWGDRTGAADELWRFEMMTNDSVKVINKTSLEELLSGSASARSTLVSDGTGAHFKLVTHGDGYSTAIKYTAGTSSQYIHGASGGGVVGWGDIDNANSAWRFEFVEGTSNGLNNSWGSKINVYTKDRKLVIEGTEKAVRLFTLSGSEIDIKRILKPGLYVVKIGSHAVKLSVE